MGILVLGCWGNLTVSWFDYSVSLDIIGVWRSTVPWFDYSVYLDIIGVWRSLVAYLLWEQGVSGSNPDTPIFSWRIFLFLGGGETLSVLEVLGENFEIMENLGEFLKSFYIRKPLSPVSSHICAGVDLYILS